MCNKLVDLHEGMLQRNREYKQDIYVQSIWINYVVWKKLLYKQLNIFTNLARQGETNANINVRFFEDINIILNFKLLFETNFR